MILVLDNYDSFTYNLVHLLYSLGTEVQVLRNRETDAEAVLNLRPEGILLSPGPGRPERAGCMPELIRAASGRIPVFGVCLGHQAIGQIFGADVIPAMRIMHGKTSKIEHTGTGVFSGLPNGFRAVRYHSLALKESTLPDVLEVTARAEDGEIMGIRHKTLPFEGVQFHPESILSVNGGRLLANFLRGAAEFHRKRG